MVSHAISCKNQAIVHTEFNDLYVNSFFLRNNLPNPGIQICH
jgi:hypothetical protein